MATLNADQLQRLGVLVQKLNEALSDTGLAVGFYSGVFEISDEEGKSVGYLSVEPGSGEFTYEREA